MTSNNNNPLVTRLDELRSRIPPTSAAENTSGFTTPSRYSGSFMQGQTQQLMDARASLQRRFTTDTNKMPITPIGQQPSQAADLPEDKASLALRQVTILERKRKEHEMLREHRLQMQKQLESLNMKEAYGEDELNKLTQDLQNASMTVGHQSEPTTPPEYRDGNFQSVFSRANRYSLSSLVSPPGLNNRSSRSGSQLTSPPSEIAQTLHNHINSDTLPSKSVPSSRRGSSDRFSAYNPEIFSTNTTQRGPAASNRYSMPVTSSRTRNNQAKNDYASTMGLGHINTTGFLFGDDDDKSNGNKESATSPDVKNYLHMNATDDRFPILVRRNEQPGVLSASSAALDLALSQSPAPETQGSGWTPFGSHRSSLNFSQKNPSVISNGQAKNVTAIGSGQKSPEAIGASRQPNRHSMEASLASYAKSTLSSQTLSNEAGRPSLANTQSSYSTNDIPTVKSNKEVLQNAQMSKPTPQEHFHNHNASLGRIPLGAVNNRQSRDYANDGRRDDQDSALPFQSTLQGGATSYGQSPGTASPTESLPSPNGQINGSHQYSNPGYYGGYTVPYMNMMSPMQMNTPLAYNSQMQAYSQQNGYGQYQSPGAHARYGNGQARVVQQRRVHNNEAERFNNANLLQMRGEIYTLCKDQHGCRFLQRKLEERDPESIHIIFLQTNQHVIELMTDPFGNYLCQKMLEYSNDEQRTVLINNAAPQMVKIALNQHGTRALQKMIEFISTAEQTQTIIDALRDQVVELIQDLNGNHVIQKCLNHLTPTDAQFIFDAVGANAVVVGTHRHGCCVLQRCIDHASGFQKANLISQITDNAFSLVQDPFGNYVLQYIIDLGEPAFTEPMCFKFRGSVSALSKQKFSSNVVEKCIRGAEGDAREAMISEMFRGNELEKMLRDNFANYVVQTALDYATPETKDRLIEGIRPHMAAIRNTSYGRRIQSKLNNSDNQQGMGSHHSNGSGSATPNGSSTLGHTSQASQVFGQNGPNGYGVSSYAGYQDVNGGYGNFFPNAYQVNGHVPSYNQSNGIGANNHPQAFNNGPNLNGTPYTTTYGGSTLYAPTGPDGPLNSFNQPNSAYTHAPPVNGFTYF